VPRRLFADLRTAGPIDRRHRVHDAQHRRDDAESWQRVGDTLHRMSGLARFLVVRLQFVVEQAFQLVRIQIAADDQTQAIGDEFDHVVVGQDARIVGEELALLRMLHVCFNREHAGLADLDQNVVDQFQQVDIVLALVLGALDQPHGSAKGALDDLQRIADDERAQCGANDGDHFARMPQQQNAAAFHDERDHHAQQNDDRTNDREHERYDYRLSESRPVRISAAGVVS
jgi:hypothetical protein